MTWKFLMNKRKTLFLGLRKSHIHRFVGTFPFEGKHLDSQTQLIRTRTSRLPVNDVIRFFRALCRIQPDRSVLVSTLEHIYAKHSDNFCALSANSYLLLDGMVHLDFPLGFSEERFVKDVLTSLQERFKEAVGFGIEDAKTFGVLSHFCRRNSVEVNKSLLDCLSDTVIRQAANLHANILCDYLIAYTLLTTQECEPFILCKLTQLVSDKLHGVKPPMRLVRLAEAGVRQDPIDYAFMNDIARTCGTHANSFESATIIHQLAVFSRSETIDDSFLLAFRKRLLDSASSLSTHQIISLISILPKYDSLLDADLALLSALCKVGTDRIRDISEIAATNILIGLHRRRPKRLTPDMKTFLEVIADLCLSKWTVSGIASGISLISKLSPVFNESLVAPGLEQIKLRGVDRLNAPQLLQVLSILAHNRLFLSTGLVCDILDILISQISSPRIAFVLSPLQSVSILTSMSSLKARHEPTLAVIFGVLCGGNKSVNGYGTALKGSVYEFGKQLPRRPFRMSNCVQILSPQSTQLDVNHLVGILASCHELCAWSDVSINLAVIIRSLLLCHGLHHLKASSLAVIVQCFGNFEFLLYEKDVSFIDYEVMNQFESSGKGNKSVGTITTEIRWKSSLLRNCVEALRRHEYFLSHNWPIASKVKFALEAESTLHVLDSTFDMEEDGDLLQRLFKLTREDCLRKTEDSDGEIDEDHGVLVDEDENKEEIQEVTTAVEQEYLLDHGWTCIKDAQLGGFILDLYLTRVVNSTFQ